MPAKKKPNTAGLTDTQIFLLKCPKIRCQEVLEVVNYRTGTLDRIRGIHHITKYGWFARCPRCESEYGGEASSEPSLWVLKDAIEEAARNES